MTHKIVVLYQSLLGVYGDRGNAIVLAKRLQWRDEPAEIIDVNPGDEVPADGLVYLLGGGEDHAQVAAAQLLAADHGLRRGLDSGAALFAVCAGYQLCGKTFTIGDDDEVHDGLGLLDVETRRGAERAVGEILGHWTDDAGASHTVTGYENHAGYTSLGSGVTPFATVEVGVGNGVDGHDGAVAGNIIGTYPHGPVLPRNPVLADYLLERALGRRLDPLDHPVEQAHEALHARRVHVARTTTNRAEQTR